MRSGSSTSRFTLYPGAAGNRLGALLARAPLRDAGSRCRAGRGQLPHHRPRLSALLLCADGAGAAGGAGRDSSPRRDPRTGSVPAAAAAAPGGYISRRQPAPGQGAAAGQRGPERVHRARDQGRSRFRLLERAGRSADLLLVRRDIPRRARAQAGFAECGLRSIQSIPLVYWRILFPEPWWDTIQAESAKNNLDPYLVASLIRQESEFDPSAISYANAYGLMQLLPAVGKKMAREEGIDHFPDLPIARPGDEHSTGNALSAPDARQVWRRAGVCAGRLQRGRQSRRRLAGSRPLSGIDEFVESIPFTQTREYVEAILRNEETYRAIDEFARACTAERPRSVVSKLRLLSMLDGEQHVQDLGILLATLRPSIRIDIRQRCPATLWLEPEPHLTTVVMTFAACC